MVNSTKFPAGRQWGRIGIIEDEEEEGSVLYLALDNLVLLVEVYGEGIV